MGRCPQIRSFFWMVFFFNDGDELKAGKFDGLKDEREIKSFRPMDQPSANLPKRVDSQN